MKNESITLTPHWGDRIRELYWEARNALRNEKRDAILFGLAVFCLVVTLGVLA